MLLEALRFPFFVLLDMLWLQEGHCQHTCCSISVPIKCNPKFWPLEMEDCWGFTVQEIILCVMNRWDCGSEMIEPFTSSFYELKHEQKTPELHFSVLSILTLCSREILHLHSNFLQVPRQTCCDI